MAKTKGGLAYFADGGSTTEPTDVAIPTKETISVGGAKLPIKSAISGDIVKNLQDEIEKRSGGFWNPVLRGFERASAFTSRDPGTALAAIDTQHRAEDESIFNMRNSIAAIKAAQEQQKQARDYWTGAGQAGAGQAAPVGGTGQAQGNVGAGQNPAMQLISGLPKSLQARGQWLAAQGEYDELAKLAQDTSNHRTELQKNMETLNSMPEGPEKEQFKRQTLDKTYGTYSYFDNQGNEFKYNLGGPNDPALKGNSVPAAAPSAATGTPSQDAEAWAKANGIQISPHGGDRSYDEQKAQYDAWIANGKKGPVVAVPGTSAHETKNALDIPESARTPENIAKLEAAGFRNTVPSEPWHYERVGNAAKAPPAATVDNVAKPVNATTPAPGVDQSGQPNPYPVGSTQYAEQQTKNLQATRDVAQKGGEKASTDDAVRLDQMHKLAEAAGGTKNAAQSVIDMAMDPKRNVVMGYAHGTDPISTGLLSAGQIIGKDPDKLEESIVTSRLGGTPQLADYKNLKTISNDLGIQFAADVFKGSRMGIGLEKLAFGAKGVGTELPAEVNKMHASLIRDAAIFQETKNDMFAKWAPSHGGNMASLSQFEATPEYKQLKKDTEDKIASTYKTIVKRVDPDEKTTPNGIKYKIKG